MSNILLLNLHQPYGFSEGKLNASFVEKAKDYLLGQEHSVKIINTDSDYKPEDIDQHLADHQWADAIIVQTPVYWMGVPWSAKKYFDEVYTAGMDGRLGNGDGRSSDNPTANYGNGGTQRGTKYMFSLTFNAPKQAFSNADEYLLQGKTVDDLFLPLHGIYRFFGMEALETFVAHDVMKNPDIDADMVRFEAHLAKYFASEIVTGDQAVTAA